MMARFGLAFWLAMAPLAWASNSPPDVRVEAYPTTVFSSSERGSTITVTVRSPEGKLLPGLELMSEPTMGTVGPFHEVGLGVYRAKYHPPSVLVSEAKTVAVSILVTSATPQASGLVTLTLVGQDNPFSAPGGGLMTVRAGALLDLIGSSGPLIELEGGYRFRLSVGAILATVVVAYSLLNDPVFPDEAAPLGMDLHVIPLTAMASYELRLGTIAATAGLGVGPVLLLGSTEDELRREDMSSTLFALHGRVGIELYRDPVIIPIEGKYSYGFGRLSGALLDQPPPFGWWSLTVGVQLRF